MGWPASTRVPDAHPGAGGGALATLYLLQLFFCDLPRCWLATCLPATAAAIAVHTAALHNGRLASLQRTLDEVRAAVLDAVVRGGEEW